jgi:PKD repeat protein
VAVCLLSLSASAQYDASPGKVFPVVRKAPNATVNIKDDNSSSAGKFSYKSSGWVFSWTPTYDDAGIYEVTFISTNGETEDFETITITVNDATNLVGYWKMDDNAANTTVTDSSGSGNDGTARQYTRDLSSSGRINGALSFDGIVDYIDCGSDGSLDISGSLSISAWIKFDSRPDYRYQTIIAKRGAGTDVKANYALRKGGYEYADELQFYYHDGRDWHAYTTFGANLTWGQWYHIVVTFEFGRGKTIKLYLNNDLLKGMWTSGDGNSFVQLNTKPVTIGGLTLGHRADGSIDNVMIFDKILSEAEVSNLYREGAGLKVDLSIDNLWMYQNLRELMGSALTARVSVVDDPMGNSSYSYEWELLLPRDVILAPMSMSGGEDTDPYWSLAARGCHEPEGLSGLGETFEIRVTVTGDDYGDTGIAQVKFGVALLGDVNNDGRVDTADRAIINGFWQTGSAGPYTVRDCDLNCDGAVNIADHVIVDAIGQGILGQSSVSTPCPLR